MDMRYFAPTPNPSPRTREGLQNPRKYLKGSPSLLMGARGRGMGVSFAYPPVSTLPSSLPAAETSLRYQINERTVGSKPINSRARSMLTNVPAPEIAFERRLTSGKKVASRASESMFK